MIGDIKSQQKSKKNILFIQFILSEFRKDYSLYFNIPKEIINIISFILDKLEKQSLYFVQYKFNITHNITDKYNKAKLGDYILLISTYNINIFSIYHSDETRIMAVGRIIRPSHNFSLVKITKIFPIINKNLLYYNFQKNLEVGQEISVINAMMVLYQSYTRIKLIC